MNKTRTRNGLITVLANNVKRLRTKLGLSQTELADAVGCHYVRISEIENGRSNPTLNTLTDIAKALKTTVDKLLANPKTQKTA